MKKIFFFFVLMLFIASVSLYIFSKSEKERKFFYLEVKENKTENFYKEKGNYSKENFVYYVVDLSFEDFKHPLYSTLEYYKIKLGNKSYLAFLSHKNKYIELITTNGENLSKIKIDLKTLDFLRVNKRFVFSNIVSCENKNLFLAYEDNIIVINDSFEISSFKFTQNKVLNPVNTFLFCKGSDLFVIFNTLENFTFKTKIVKINSTLNKVFEKEFEKLSSNLKFEKAIDINNDSNFEILFYSYFDSVFAIYNIEGKLLAYENFDKGLFLLRTYLYKDKLYLFLSNKKSPYELRIYKIFFESNDLKIEKSKKVSNFPLVLKQLKNNYALLYHGRKNYSIYDFVNSKDVLNLRGRSVLIKNFDERIVFYKINERRDGSYLYYGLLFSVDGKNWKKLIDSSYYYTMRVGKINKEEILIFVETLKEDYFYTYLYFILGDKIRQKLRIRDLVNPIFIGFFDLNNDSYEEVLLASYEKSKLFIIDGRNILDQ